MGLFNLFKKYVHPMEVNSIVERIIDKHYDSDEYHDKKIKISYKDICKELNATSKQDIKTVLECLSTKILMIPNQNIFYHDVPEHEMERARIWLKNNL